MTKDTLYVGLDTDKKYFDVALAEELPRGEVRYWGKLANEASSVVRLAKRLQAGGRALEMCYEAGPCGYGLYRLLNGKPGVRCVVVAPSLTPRRPGDRIKTNRRDAITLARLLRAGELTAVRVPDPGHEAMRDLVRARGAATADLLRCRQRIAGFLLRQDIRYAGKPWTKKHRAWLGQLAPALPAHRLMIGEALQGLDEATARRDRLTDHIGELVPDWSLAWLVDALQALRGFALVNAATLAVEIGDPRRFAKPRQLMAYLGLVPCEHSSGQSVRRGGPSPHPGVASGPHSRSVQGSPATNPWSCGSTRVSENDQPSRTRPLPGPCVGPSLPSTCRQAAGAKKSVPTIENGHQRMRSPLVSIPDLAGHTEAFGVLVQRFRGSNHMLPSFSASPRRKPGSMVASPRRVGHFAVKGRVAAAWIPAFAGMTVEETETACNFKL